MDSRLRGNDVFGQRAPVFRFGKPTFTIRMV
jgi:hypothetical protein